MIEALRDPSPEVRQSVLQALTRYEDFAARRLSPDDLTGEEADALAPAVASGFDPPNELSIDYLARVAAGAKYAQGILSFAASRGALEYSTKDAVERAVRSFMHRHRSTAAEQLPLLLTIATSDGSANEVLSALDALRALIEHKVRLSPDEASRLFSLCNDLESDGSECALALRVLQTTNASGINTESLLAVLNHADPAARLETALLIAEREQLTPPSSNAIPKEFVAYAQELHRASSTQLNLLASLDLNLRDEALARALARFVPETATAEEHLAVISLAERNSPLALIAQRIVTLCARCSAAHGVYEDRAGDWTYPQIESQGPAGFWLSAAEAIAKVKEKKDSPEAGEAWEQLARDHEMANPHMSELRQALQHAGPKAAPGAMLFLASRRDTDSFVEEELLALLDRPLIANAVSPYVDQIWPKRTKWIDEWATLAGRAPEVPAPEAIRRKLRTPPSTAGNLVHVMASIEGASSADVSSALALTVDDHILWRVIGDGTLVRVAADYPDLADSFAAKIVAAYSRYDPEHRAAASFLLAQLDLTDPDLSNQLLALQRANPPPDLETRCWTAVVEGAKNTRNTPPTSVHDCIVGTKGEMQAAISALVSIPHFPPSYLAAVRLLPERTSHTLRESLLPVLQRVFDQDPRLFAKLWSELTSAENQHQLTALLGHQDDLEGLSGILMQSGVPTRDWLLPVLSHWDPSRHGGFVSALRMLTSMHKGAERPSLADLASLLDLKKTANQAQHVALLHVLSGGDADAQILVNQFRRFGSVEKASYQPDEARRILGVLSAVLTADSHGKRPLDPASGTFRHLASQMERILLRTQWSDREVNSLRAYLPILEEAATDGRSNVAAIITRNNRLTALWTVAQLGLGHLVFWFALIFVYPHSPLVQATFFWNKWCRRLLGLGYVGLLISWTPILRRRLFAPFRESLLADAELDTFDPSTYFADSLATLPSGQQQPVVDVLARPKGRIILQGDSGLGKTMFLRYHASRVTSICVYLTAERCTNGVMHAIRAKLLGAARDETFLKTLIYAGALDVFIDGVNEVSPDTRAEIAKFMEELFKGNFIVTTQRLSWSANRVGTVVELAPLKKDQILEYLLGRYSTLDQPEVSHSEYRDACSDFVESVHAAKTVDPALRTLLSNPMDLSIAAQLLGMRRYPEMFKLHDQQYGLMAAEYAELFPGRSFPLRRFCEMVYKYRLEDLPIPETADLGDELATMARFKLVLVRYAASGGLREWGFRHDKIRDYFLAQAFLGKSNQRPIEHFGDPRFSGVYALLAVLLPEEEATLLKNALVEHAADTKDHLVSDRFVQILRARTRAGSGSSRHGQSDIDELAG